MAEKEQIKEEMIKKFKNMGIPIPLKPMSPSEIQVPIKNKDFAKKLLEIQNGQKRKELNTFIEKDGVTKALGTIPVPPSVKGKKNPNVPPPSDVPPLIVPSATAGPDFTMYEKALYEDGGTQQAQQTYNPREIPDNRLPDEKGTQFLNEFRGKLNEKLSEKERQIRSNQSQVPAGYTLINEEDLKRKIIDISTQVSKKMIKTVLSEYAKTQGKVITESSTVKKAEIVGQNVVKIDGKTFKLTPIK